MAALPTQPQTLAAVIAAHARSNPDAVAILSPAREPLSYRALVRQMDSTAEALAAGGFALGSRIGVALPNGPETVVALLAVMSSVTCVPLNPNSDAETIRSLCRRLRVDALIVREDASDGLRGVARDLAIPILTLVGSALEPAGSFTLRCETGRQPVSVTAPGPDDLALVLHTSGTTGTAKAVPFDHRSQHDGTLERVQRFRLTPRDRGVCLVPAFTGYGLRRGVLPPLASGGSVVCPQMVEGEQLLQWLSQLEPTFYVAGPAMHKEVLEAVVRRGSVPRHTLRYIFSAATALPEEVQAGLEEAFGVPVIQTYGMTEAGAITQDSVSSALRRRGSVGLPVRAEVGILGGDGQFLPAGESGEIVVRGPEVFRGYEDDPEANRQAFFGDWFRTGDLGYLDRDGYLYLTGRLKEFINRGGAKVSPTEVDSVLMRHPAVVEAATFGVSHAAMGEDIVAAVILREGSAATPQQLRDFAFAALADFKVPSRVVPVSRIPKTPLGKVSRRELAENLAPTLQPAYHAPRDRREALVAGLFADVLGIAPVGCFDNFFALGGDSLRGAQITSRLNAMLACRLDAATLFRRPTVAELAAEIAVSGAGAHATAAPPIVRLPRNAGMSDGGEQVGE